MNMKKIFFIALLSFVAFAPTAFANGFTALAPIPGLTSGDATSVVNSATLTSFFNNLYKYLIGLAAMLAIIEIIWGGLQISSSQGSASKVSEGRERITQAIFGLILVLSPVLVFSLINPSILNLSLDLPPIDLNAPPPPSSGTSPSGSGSNTDPATTAAKAAGCTVTGTLLKTAVCPTQKAAEDFAAKCTTGSGNVPFFTTEHKATCSTERGPATGPYAFADISSSSGVSGWVNAIVGYSYYQPIASTETNPNNGRDTVNFASACTSDKGVTCMSSVKTPCGSKVLQILTTGASASCWNISLSCTTSNTGAGGCSSNPGFKVVQ